MFSSSRGAYAPLNDDVNGHRSSKFGHTPHMVQRFLPESRTFFRVLLGATFALGIIALLKTTGTSDKVRKYWPQGSEDSCDFDCSLCPSRVDETKDIQVDSKWKFDWRRDGPKYGLSESQCDAAFPGLWKDMYISLEKRNGVNVTLEEFDESMEGEGAIRCMIYDGQVRTLTLCDTRLHRKHADFSG